MLINDSIYLIDEALKHVKVRQEGQLQGGRGGEGMNEGRWQGGVVVVGA